MRRARAHTLTRAPPPISRQPHLLDVRVPSLDEDQDACSNLPPDSVVAASLTDRGHVAYTVHLPGPCLVSRVTFFTAGTSNHLKVLAFEASDDKRCWRELLVQHENEEGVRRETMTASTSKILSQKPFTVLGVANWLRLTVAGTLVPAAMLSDASTDADSSSSHDGVASSPPPLRDDVLSSAVLDHEQVRVLLPVEAAAAGARRLSRVRSIAIDGFRLTASPGGRKVVPLLNLAQQLESGQAYADAAEAVQLTGLASLQARRFVQAGELFRKAEALLLKCATRRRPVPANASPLPRHRRTATLDSLGSLTSLGANETADPLLVSRSSMTSYDVKTRHRIATLELLVADACKHHPMSQPDGVRAQVLAYVRAAQWWAADAVPGDAPCASSSDIGAAAAASPADVVSTEAAAGTSLQDDVSLIVSHLPLLVDVLCGHLQHALEAVQRAAVTGLDFLLDTLACTAGYWLLPITQALMMTWPCAQRSDMPNSPVSDAGTPGHRRHDSVADGERMPRQMTSSGVAGDPSPQLMDTYARLMDSVYRMIPQVGRDICASLMTHVLCPVLLAHEQLQEEKETLAQQGEQLQHGEAQLNGESAATRLPAVTQASASGVALPGVNVLSLLQRVPLDTRAGLAPGELAPMAHRHMLRLLAACVYVLRGDAYLTSPVLHHLLRLTATAPLVTRRMWPVLIDSALPFTHPSLLPAAHAWCAHEINALRHNDDFTTSVSLTTTQKYQASLLIDVACALVYATRSLLSHPVHADALAVLLDALIDMSREFCRAETISVFRLTWQALLHIKRLLPASAAPDLSAIACSLLAVAGARMQDASPPQPLLLVVHSVLESLLVSTSSDVTMPVPDAPWRCCAAVVIAEVGITSTRSNASISSDSSAGSVDGSRMSAAQAAASPQPTKAAELAACVAQAAAGLSAQTVATLTKFLRTFTAWVSHSLFDETFKVLDVLCRLTFPQLACEEQHDTIVSIVRAMLDPFTIKSRQYHATLSFLTTLVVLDVPSATARVHAVPCFASVLRYCLRPQQQHERRHVFLERLAFASQMLQHVTQPTHLDWLLTSWHTSVQDAQAILSSGVTPALPAVIGVIQAMIKAVRNGQRVVPAELCAHFLQKAIAMHVNAPELHLAVVSTLASLLTTASSSSTSEHDAACLLSDPDQPEIQLFDQHADPDALVCLTHLLWQPVQHLLSSPWENVRIACLDVLTRWTRMCLAHGVPAAFPDQCLRPFLFWALTPGRDQLSVLVGLRLLALLVAADLPHSGVSLSISACTVLDDAALWRLAAPYTAHWQEDVASLAAALLALRYQRLTSSAAASGTSRASSSAPAASGQGVAAADCFQSGLDRFDAAVQRLVASNPLLDASSVRLPPVTTPIAPGSTSPGVADAEDVVVRAAKQRVGPSPPSLWTVATPGFDDLELIRSDDPAPRVDADSRGKEDGDSVADAADAAADHVLASAEASMSRVSSARSDANAPLRSSSASDHPQQQNRRHAQQQQQAKPCAGGVLRRRRAVADSDEAAGLQQAFSDLGIIDLGDDGDALAIDGEDVSDASSPTSPTSPLSPGDSSDDDDDDEDDEDDEEDEEDFAEDDQDDEDDDPDGRVDIESDDTAGGQSVDDDNDDSATTDDGDDGAGFALSPSAVPLLPLTPLPLLATPTGVYTSSENDEDEDANVVGHGSNDDSAHNRASDGKDSLLARGSSSGGRATSKRALRVFSPVLSARKRVSTALTRSFSVPSIRVSVPDAEDSSAAVATSPESASSAPFPLATLQQHASAAVSTPSKSLRRSRSGPVAMRVRVPNTSEDLPAPQPSLQ